jgi:hypothetical protein
VGKRVLFLAAVVGSLTMPVLGDDVGFQGGTPFSRGITGGAIASPDGVSCAILFNGTLTGGRTNTLWGNGRSVGGSIVEDRFNASSQRSLASIVKLDDGVISISVPEPGTMGTLATGSAMMIAWLVGGKRRKSKCFLH